ncbi:MAG: hypothetical protein H6765_11315 [Candidatus Peribacteria bacterium]|nr:MAG: hypothetical protein H6765_11315 [Candidatus Peribacteria bacterium]
MLGSGIDASFFSIPVSMRGLFVMMWVISYLYYQNVTHVAFHLRKHHLHNHVRLGIIFFFFLVLILSEFVPEVHALLQLHLPELLTLLFVSYIMLLELVMQQYSIDTYYMKHQGKH